MREQPAVVGTAAVVWVMPGSRIVGKAAVNVPAECEAGQPKNKEGRNVSAVATTTTIRERSEHLEQQLLQRTEQNRKRSENASNVHLVLPPS